MFVPIIRYITAFVMIAFNLFNFLFNDYAYPALSVKDAYLFVYFTGNSAEEQRINMAISSDGYRFQALNDNKPIIEQELGTGCCRDPYILKGQDGCYYIIATDMDANLGWTSNHALVTWKSEDLINWTDETVIDIRDLGGEFANTNRAWAPQAIWDPEVEMYMVYWAHSTFENDVAGHYYAYTKDFKTFETEPKPLYGRWDEGIQCIDADIVYNEDNGYYYLYFKYDETQKIAYVKSKSLTGPYDTEDPVIVSLGGHGVEGSTMYNINGTDSWVMIMDEYGTGHFYTQQTNDFENFKRVNRDITAMDHLKPRHGSVVTITLKEYNALKKEFGVQEIPDNPTIK